MSHQHSMILKTSCSMCVVPPLLAWMEWDTTCTSDFRLSCCRCFRQFFRAAGRTNKFLRVGNSAWYVYSTRKVCVMTRQTGGPFAFSKPFTSCTLEFLHGGWCGGWMRMTATRPVRRAFGR